MKRLFCILCAVLMLAACTAKADPTQTEPEKTDADPVVTGEPVEIHDVIDPDALPDFTVPEIKGYAGFADVLAAKLVDGTCLDHRVRVKCIAVFDDVGRDAGFL